MSLEAMKSCPKMCQFILRFVGVPFFLIEGLSNYRLLTFQVLSFGRVTKNAFRTQEQFTEIFEYSLENLANSYVS